MLLREQVHEVIQHPVALALVAKQQQNESQQSLPVAQELRRNRLTAALGRAIQRQLHAEGMLDRGGAGLAGEPHREERGERRKRRRRKAARRLGGQVNRPERLLG